MTDRPAYKRILIKLSGEALAGERATGIDPGMVVTVARQLKAVCDLGVETCVVVGGGNIFRGISAAAKAGMDRATADYMGMLATIMNSLAIQEACEKIDVVTRVQSAIEMKQVAEPYVRRKAIRHLEKGRLVIFAGGTGNPFFTTDTTAALRAAEMNCALVIKATKVDGVFDSDPEKNTAAKRYEKITYMEAIQQRLQVMDSTALSLCMDNDIPMVVLNIFHPDNLQRCVMGEKFLGTLIANS